MLSLPFTVRFDQLSDDQRQLYLASLVLAALLAGTTIMLDPAGQLYATIGPSNLRPFGLVQGQDGVGHAGLGN
jgi:hypothetical protein